MPSLSRCSLRRVEISVAGRLTVAIRAGDLSACVYAIGTGPIDSFRLNSRDLAKGSPPEAVGLYVTVRESEMASNDLPLVVDVDPLSSPRKPHRRIEAHDRSVSLAQEAVTNSLRQLVFAGDFVLRIYGRGIGLDRSIGIECGDGSVRCAHKSMSGVAVLIPARDRSVAADAGRGSFDRARWIEAREIPLLPGGS